MNNNHNTNQNNNTNQNHSTNQKQLHKDLRTLKASDKIYGRVMQTEGLVCDLETLKAYCLKDKIVASRHKFDDAVKLLIEEGKVVVKNHKITGLSYNLKPATFVFAGTKSYVVLDGELQQRQVSSVPSGLQTHDKVNVVFVGKGDTARPVIVSKRKEESVAQSEKGSLSELISNLPQKDTNLVVGRVMQTMGNDLEFIPNDRSRFKKNIIILNQKKGQFQDKICSLRICEEEKANLPACGMVETVLGIAGNPIDEFAAIAQSHGSIMSWDEEAQANEQLKKEIDAIPTEVDLSGKKLVTENGTILQNGNGEKIVDLRHLCFTTVDPATCKDMDDAIFSTYENGKLVVYTAVANVPKYIELNSEIGKRYLQGGFTTYAPNKAYNILPTQLSTGICSLNENEDRLAYVVKTVIDEKTGEPISSEIMDAVIRSHKKYSYEEAQTVYDLNKSFSSLEQLKGTIEAQGKLSLEQQVVLNFKAADILWKGFNSRHLIRFDSQDEYNVEFNQARDNILSISAEENVAYHKVIEAFMVTANEATAQFAKNHGIDIIYRVHDKPNENKIEMAQEAFGYFEIPFDDDLSPLGIQKILDSVVGNKNQDAVNELLIRMQSKAKYNISTNPNGAEFIKVQKNKPVEKFNQDIEKSLDVLADISHFGLQSKAYAHTTSPIRRITDYVTIHNVLAYLEGTEPIDKKTVLEIALLANEREDSVDAAEIEFAEVDSAIFCENQIGEIMSGYVRGFKKMIDSEDGADNIMVIVKNKETGVKVQIPATELLPKGVKNVTISPFKSAVICKKTSTPYITFRNEVAFKILSSNRKTRQILATTDLEIGHEIKDDDTPTNNNGNNGKNNSTPNGSVRSKVQRMLDERDFKKDYTNSHEFQEDLIDSRGNRSKKTFSARSGVEVEGSEAYMARKIHNQMYKSRKNDYIEKAVLCEIAEL